MQKVNVLGGSSSSSSQSRKPCLGILTRTVVTKAKDLLYSNLPSDDVELERFREKQRWRLQKKASSLLPGERVGACCRELGYGQEMVQIQAGVVDGRRKARFTGLMRCDSVWGCIICAARICYGRQLELQQGVEIHEARGRSAFLLSLTMQHKASERIDDTLDEFKKSVKTLKQSRAWRSLNENLVGHVSALEVTRGTTNGFHPHMHILLFCEPPMITPRGVQIGGFGLEPPKSLTRELTKAWLKALKKNGRKALEGVGLDLRGKKAGKNFAASYVAKWGMDSELARGDKKRGSGCSMTPFELLAAACLEELTSEERDAFGRLFQSYYYAFKGRKQLTWSPGLKKKLLIEEVEDSEIEEVFKIEWERDIVRVAWRSVLHHEDEARLLNLAREGRYEECNDLICWHTRQGFFLEPDRPVSASEFTNEFDFLF